MIHLAAIENIKALGLDPKVLACQRCGKLRIDLAIVERVAVLLWMFKEVKITSGCRCWKHHVATCKKYGQTVTKGSFHLITDEAGNEMISQAIDLGGNPIQLRSINMSLGDTWIGGFHFYDRGASSSVHVDSDTRKRRWV